MAVVAPNLSDEADALLRRYSLVGRALNFARRKPLGMIGLVIVVLFALAGGFADWIAPFDPEENDFASMMVAPGFAHWLAFSAASKSWLMNS